MNYPLCFAVIGLGAALGAWGRWLLGLVLNPLFKGVPLGTLAANLIGGFLAGVALGVFQARGVTFSPTVKLFILTGFLGGLTTFSSFSAETTERLLSGQLGSALALIGLHLVGSLAMTWLGFVSVNTVSLLD